MKSLYYINNRRCKGYFTDDETKSGIYNKIDMTAGGGMGGSSWSVYTKDDINMDNLKEKFIKVIDIRDKERIIGTNFITEIYKINVKIDYNGELSKEYWKDRRRKITW